MSFDLFHEVGDGECARLDKQHVDMIAWAIHEQRLTSQLIDRASQIAKGLVADFRGERGLAVLGAEKRVNQNVSVGVGHGNSPSRINRMSPLAGLLS